MTVKKHRFSPRKLLVASAGVAAVSFVGIGSCSTSSVANLPAPPSCEVAPDDPFCTGPHPDAATDAGPDAETAEDSGSGAG
jgi:hypothetical protein